ncbi:MAG: lipid biosynthesis B12-binding/radical SAM protein [Pseudomonadota bacterium]
MKVLLISANTVVTPYPVYPVGLDYVSGALAERHRVRILDMNMVDLKALGAIIDTFTPEVIGVSLRNIDNTDIVAPQGFMAGYKALVNRVREHSGAPVVLGGAGFSILPEAVMAALGADYGIVGEGERMAALLDAIERGEPACGLPGVITASGNFTPPAPFPEPPPRHFNPAGEQLPFYLQRGGMLNLQTKRGCPFRCIYCTYPLIEGRRFRRIAPETVARNARELQDAGARFLFIADSAFNADVEHSLAVAQHFQKAGITLPWGAFMAPMQMPAAYFDSLAAAGLTHIEFGTESLSNRMLESYGKPFDREQILHSHKTAVDAGLRVAHYFLFGGPGETADTLETTLGHLDKLKKSVLFLFCGMRIYPRTELFDRALAEGLITETQDFLEPVFYQSPSISREEIIGRIKARGGHRISWVIGAEDEKTGPVISRMYERGYTGPLWEFLIR